MKHRVLRCLLWSHQYYLDLKGKAASIYLNCFTEHWLRGSWAWPERQQDNCVRSMFQLTEDNDLLVFSPFKIKISWRNCLTASYTRNIYFSTYQNHIAGKRLLPMILDEWQTHSCVGCDTKHLMCEMQSPSAIPYTYFIHLRLSHSFQSWKLSEMWSAKGQFHSNANR